MVAYDAVKSVCSRQNQFILEQNRACIGFESNRSYLWTHHTFKYWQRRNILNIFLIEESPDTVWSKSPVWDCMFHSAPWFHQDKLRGERFDDVYLYAVSHAQVEAGFLLNVLVSLKVRVEYILKRSAIGSWLIWNSWIWSLTSTVGRIYVGYEVSLLMDMNTQIQCWREGVVDCLLLLSISMTERGGQSSLTVDIKSHVHCRRGFTESTVYFTEGCLERLMHHEISQCVNFNWSVRAASSNIKYSWIWCLTSTVVGTGYSSTYIY